MARERKVSRSKLVREAIGAFVAGSREKARSPYATARDLIGTVRGGPPDLSVRTGARMRELLIDRRDRDAER
jgi:hypothetical protein